MTSLPDATLMEDLIARLEKATGPDRYVDCWLACALEGFFPVIKEWPVRGGGWTWKVDFCCYRDGGLVSPGHGGDQMVRHYSASVDEALALVERVLPGSWPGVERTRRAAMFKCWTAFIDIYPAPEWTVFEAEAPTAPLALLRALSSACLRVKS